MCSIWHIFPRLNFHRKWIACSTGAPSVMDLIDFSMQWHGQKQKREMPIEGMNERTINRKERPKGTNNLRSVQYKPAVNDKAKSQMMQRERGSQRAQSFVIWRAKQSNFSIFFSLFSVEISTYIAHIKSCATISIAISAVALIRPISVSELCVLSSSSHGTW